MSSNLDLVSSLLTLAKKAGADAADATMFDAAAVSVALRLGKPENIERSESKGFGLRVLVGSRQAIVSSTDTSYRALSSLAERAVAMAKAAPEDPHVKLAPEELLATHLPDLDLYDAAEPSVAVLEERARRTEDAALAIPGITNSEGADASYSSSHFAIAATNGFAASCQSSSSAIAVSVLAGEGTGMERDDDFSVARFSSDLAAPERIGQTAANRAIRRLHPQKAKTAQLPVVFDPRVSRTLLGSFASAINGAAIARGTSFLKNRMGERIFGEHITIVDEPHRLRGLASRPFDGEGVAPRKMALIERGVLTSWLLDVRSASMLNLTTTGSALRGLSSPPSPSATNLYMENGTLSPTALMEDIQSGFYVTDLFGMGINLITGDYSQGASGFWIEKGEIAYPVSEVTIAGNLADMFRQLTPANDLQFCYAVNAPTVRIERMTIAGV